MQYSTFVFEAPLMDSATSSSGHVEPRQGFTLGWLGSVVVGLAVVFGTADRTPADPCFGIAEGSSGSHTTSLPCDWKEHKPAEYWQDHYFHHPPEQNQQDQEEQQEDSEQNPRTLGETYRQDHYFHHPGTPKCTYLYSTCGPSPATAILVETATTPTAFALGANYPNPFNPATIIPFAVPAEAGDVDLTIYNVLGQPVRYVWNGPLVAGEYRLVWDGRDAQGQPVAAGVYLYQLQVGDQTLTRKMVKLE